METQIFNGNRKGAVDIDDTLLEFYIPFIRFYSARTGRKIDIDSLQFTKLENALNISEQEVKNAIFDFYSSPSFGRLTPVTGSVYAISQLSKKFNLGVITSRPDFTREVTMMSLQRHFPERFCEVHFTNSFGGNGHRERKSEYCRDHDYSFIVDDVPEYANECAESGITSLLLKKKWNEEAKLHPLVIPVNDWRHVLEILQ